LWTIRVFEDSVGMKGIGCWRYFQFAATAVPVFLAGGRHNDARQVADASGFRFTPAQMDSQSGDTVEWMLLVDGDEGSNAALITAPLRGWCAVVGRAVYA
jgi:hypothetical protein